MEEGAAKMAPREQILAGLALGATALAGGLFAMPAIADTAADQRVGVDTAELAEDFRYQPEPTPENAAVTRLAELYGPDSRVDSPLQRVSLDLEEIASDTAVDRRFSEASNREAKCLAEAVYYEARGETRKGQVAVAQVVANRVHSKHFPDTICDVVYQGSERTTGCQFSFTCDGSMDREPVGKPWERAQLVASYVMTQSPRSLVGRSTHYHTKAVSPVWARTLKRQKVVGAHIFYSWRWMERPRTDSPQVSVSLDIAPPPA